MVTYYDSALNVKCQDVVISISDDIKFIHFVSSISWMVFIVTQAFLV